MDSDPEAIEQYVSSHLPTILNYAISNMKRSGISLKFGLKILTVLFGEYQLECSPQGVHDLEMTAEFMVKEYVVFLNNALNEERGEFDLDEEQEPIEVALYQIMELFTILLDNKMKLDLDRVIYLAIISTFMGAKQYSNYVAYSDNYLMDIEDEGQVSIRNKAIFFLLELIETPKYGRKCKELLTEYIEVVLANLNAIHENVTTFLAKHSLPLEKVKTAEIYTESALFILNSFTDELLKGKVDEMSVILGNEVKASAPQSIDTILAVLILTKSLRTSPTKAKAFYLSFLRESIEKYSSNIGMLIAISRGIYQLSPIPELALTNERGTGVPLAMIASLTNYLLRDDSAQDEAAYLVL